MGLLLNVFFIFRIWFLNHLDNFLFTWAARTGAIKFVINGLAGVDIGDLSAIKAGMPAWSKSREEKGMNPNILPTNKERAVYEFFRSIFPEKVEVTEGFLRSIICVPAFQAQSQLNFIFTKIPATNTQSSVNFTTQNQLDLTDIFQVMDFKFYYLTAPAVNPPVAVGGIANPAIPFSVLTPEYFNNGNVFSAPAPAGSYSEAQGLEAPYNSWLYVKLEDTVYFEQYPMAGFKQPSISQEGVAVSTAATGVITQSSETADRMKKPVTPIIELMGPGKNQWQVQMQDPVILSPQNAGSATVRGYSYNMNYIVMELHGLKCQGAMTYHQKGHHNQN